MTLRVQQDIIRLDIPVDDALFVNVFQCTSQLCNPESNGLFGESLSRNVESQVPAIHQVYHQVPLQTI